MNLTVRKILLWMAVLAGACVALLLGFVLFRNAAPQVAAAWIGTAAFIVGGLALQSGRMLCAIYREELRDAPGRWQFTLRELLLSSWITALMMLTAYSFCPQGTLPVGIVAALLLGLCFAANLLLHARRGGNLAFQRVIGALGAICKIAGWTALFATLCVDSEFRTKLFFADTYKPNQHDYGGLYSLLRIGLLCLPTGYLLAAFSKRLLATPTFTDSTSKATLERLLQVKKAATQRSL